MLAENTYTQDYIDGCRARIKAQVSTYRKLVTSARKQAGANAKPLDAAIGTFEPVFCNNMVLALDRYFVHRTRTIEGKDGNPLNEVRMLCTSMTQNDGVMTADRTIKDDPATPVLKHQIGDKVRLSEADLQRLFKAFMAELEAKFLAPG